MVAKERWSALQNTVDTKKSAVFYFVTITGLEHHRKLDILARGASNRRFFNTVEPLNLRATKLLGQNSV